MVVFVVPENITLTLAPIAVLITLVIHQQEVTCINSSPFSSLQDFDMLSGKLCIARVLSIKCSLLSLMHPYFFPLVRDVLLLVEQCLSFSY